jgi:hypothetical protein
VKGTKTQTKERKKERNESKNPDTTGSTWGERVQEKEKDGEIQICERKQVLDGRRETIEHMSNGCSEIREGLGKKRGEILNEDGREMDER